MNFVVYEVEVERFSKGHFHFSRSRMQYTHRQSAKSRDLAGVLCIVHIFLSQAAGYDILRAARITARKSPFGLSDEHVTVWVCFCKLNHSVLNLKSTMVKSLN